MKRYNACDYTYRVFWSEEDEAWVSVADEFKYLSNLSESSQLDAFTGMVELLQSVLDDLYGEGQEPPAPFSMRSYSGHISLRMTPEQHRRIAIESAEQGVSINQLLVSRV
mgnify:CR=1 FL=1